MRLEHIDDLDSMHRNAEVMATLGGVRSRAATTQIIEAAVEHWRQHGFGLWMAFDLESGRFAGRGGLKHTWIEGRDEVEVAYGFMPAFWGLGLATELAAESVRVAFETLQLPQLVCFTMTSNHASQQVMRKVGFRYERDFEYAGLPHLLCRQFKKDWDAR